MIARRQNFRIPAAALFLMAAVVAQAASDAYLQLPGISGDATEPYHAKWIEVLSCDQSVTNISADGLGQVSKFALVKKMDSSSPLLMRGCATGQRFTSARLQFVNPENGAQVVYEVQLNNAIVSSIAPACGGTNSISTETVTLVFSKISWIRNGFDRFGYAAGGFEAYWDFRLNAGGRFNLPAPFRITNLQKQGDQVTLTWNALAGRTYMIYSSSTVRGDYAYNTQAACSVDGPAALTVPATAPIQFYRIQQTP